MIADLVVLFPAPCSLLLILYSIRFTVARSEAEAVSGVTNGASPRRLGARNRKRRAFSRFRSPSHL